MRKCYQRIPCVLLLFCIISSHTTAQLVINNGLSRLMIIRYEENYDDFIVTDSTRFIEKIKHLQFGKNNSYVSFGGEVRLAFEHTKNPLLGLEKGIDKAGLIRSYIHADNHFGKKSRVYIEMASGFKHWGLNPPISIQEDQLFLHQFFVEYNFSTRVNKRIIARIGRQELKVGSGRILSPRVGPNIRQSFDVFRLVFKGFSKWNFTAFYGRPVFNQLGVLDNEVLDKRSPEFWNVATTRSFKHLNADIYYFGYQKKKAIYIQGIGDELRHSIGGRIYANKKFDFDIEALYQFGKFGANNIKAFTFSANLGYSYKDMLTKPRLGLKLDYISGDRSRFDGNLQTFNAMFPDGGYFAGVNALGPSNLFDIHPSIDYEFSKNLRLSTGGAFVWRSNLTDGLYNPAGFILVNDTGNNAARFVGTQFTQTARWEINRYFSVIGIIAHFFAGDYLNESKNPTRTSTDFYSIMGTFQF